MNTLKETISETLVAMQKAGGLSGQPDDGSRERWCEAQETLEQLRPFARTASIAELRARIPDASLRAAVALWKWGDGSLCVLGPTGSGKSTAITVIFRRLISNGIRDGGDAWDRARRLRWFYSRDLTADVREHAFGRGEAPELLAAKRASLLFLDDIGWEHEPRTIAEVLESRYSECRPTIITSGLRPTELSRHLGEAVARRIVESGGPGRGRVLSLHNEPLPTP